MSRTILFLLSALLGAGQVFAAQKIVTFDAALDAAAQASLIESRGGRVLTMYFHSSELKPETNPLFTTEAAVGRFVDKIRAFLTWLVKLAAIALTRSVRSFQVPATPGTAAWPPNFPSVPTSLATRVTSLLKLVSRSTILL